MVVDVVASVKPLVEARDGAVIWWEVKLDGFKEPFALHMNYFASYKQSLKPGDQVEYVVSNVKLGFDGTQGVDREGWLLFEKLRKLEEKKSLEEEMLNLVEEGT